MSMTGSLMGYENNNEVNQAKCKKPLKPLPVVSSVSAGGGVTTTTSKSRKSRIPQKRESCTRGHVNSLWSVWYGILAVAFQAYIATRCAKRFVAYLSLPWPADAPPPKIELHACLVLAGTGVLLLPVLLAAAFFKLGNLANDGIKLGRHLSACSRDPPSSLLTNNPDNGLANNLWRHGGPTAAFVHLCTAMCFLLPSLLMEARLIHAGFLPKAAIWRTDLDWVVVHRDRLVVLSFMHPVGNLSTLSESLTPLPYVTANPYEDDEETIKSINELLNAANDSMGTSHPKKSNSGTTRLSTVLQTNGKPMLTTSKTSTTISVTAATTASSSSSTVPIPITRSSGSRSSSTNANTRSESGSGTESASSPSTMKPIRPTTTAAPDTTTSGTKQRSTNFLRSAVTKSKSNKIGNGNNRSNGNTKKVPVANGSKNNGNMSAQSLPLTMNSLADLDHPENLNLEIQANDENYGPITLEYLNYAVALGVYSVRYPAVFWSCNKALGTIFSVQLVANSAQSLLAYAGMSVLYKVQVVGPLKVLPLLRHRTVTTASTISTFFGDSFFLLNPHVTLAIFALSSLLMLCSSMVMYLYAHGRFVAFLNQQRERRVILSKDTREGSGWGYFTHCAALCVFLAIAICNAPLLYDYTVVYRGSLDGAILACIIGTVLHLFLWLVLWIFLTIRKKWIFKLRVTIGRATVRSARSVKLVTDVDLLSARDDDEGTNAPLLVVGNGRTYTIADTSPKKAIMSVIQKAAMERKARSQGGNMDLVDGESTGDGDEQIYWLRPKLRPSPAQSPNDAATNGNNEKGWLNKKLKPKVTFNDLPSTSGSRNKGKTRRGVADGGPDDDGDYATLRELPLMTVLDPADDSTSEENKLLECVNDDQVTYYASANRDLQPSEGDPSPLLTPDPLPDPVEEPLPLPPPTPTSIVPTNNEVISTTTTATTTTTTTSSSTTTSLTTASTNPQLGSGQTPRCLRRADSGMPHDELTPRSDTSNSPPLDLVGVGSTGHSNTSSETSSSGVHSNASNASNGSSQRRATSVDDLTGEPREEPGVNQWRSCSLQRGIQPPSFSNGKPRSSQSFSSPQYVNHTPLYNNNLANGTLLEQQQQQQLQLQQQQQQVLAGCSAVILENPNEATVVIRRKLSRSKLTEPLNPNEEPFGRSTNMRMTSFTENNDLRNIQASSATLPHYPTQPVITYPHCSTMPLPHTSTHIMSGNNSIIGNINAGNNNISGGSTGSCGSVPKHTISSSAANAQPVHGTVPTHTTLPSHHNGVRLLTAPPQNNPFVKRFPPQQQAQVHTQNWSLTGHHTFPQAPIINNKLTITAQIRQSDRDSANFSMASSGDSDTCLPH